MELKQYTLKNGSKKRLKGESEKKTWYKWKWKHSIPKHMNAAKAVLKEKFIMINAYIKSNERSQIKKFTFHIKKLEKEKKTVKLTERRK